MKKSLATVMTFVLMIVSILPGVRPAPLHAASAYAPPPPTLPTPTPPSVGPGEGNGPPHAPPSPDEFAPEVEQARARQAIEAVLEKTLRYWGPRYRVAPVEVTVEGDWAYGLAKWQSEARILAGPIHILAHRLPQGIWQALMPSGEGLYLQWVAAVPKSLVPDGEKEQLRVQAAEADTLHQPKTTAVIAPHTIKIPPSKEERSKAPQHVLRSLPPVATPSPVSLFKLQILDDETWGYTLMYPEGWSIQTAFTNDNDRPNHVIRQRIALSGPRAAEVTVDVWQKETSTGLMNWIDENQRPFLELGSVELPFTTNGVVDGQDALVVTQAGTCMSPQLFFAYINAGDRVLLVQYTAHDGGDALEHYIALLHSLEIEVPLGIRESREDAIPELLYSANPLGNCEFAPNEDGCCGYPQVPHWQCSRDTATHIHKGNCTYWAAYKRPDVGAAVGSGNAGQWASKAQAAGCSVDTNPASGDIMVIEGDPGHVAYVTSVSGSTVYVTEMNWCTTCPERSEDYSSSGKKFIHTCGGTCSAPSLVSPGDGETVHNRTVTLDWNAPNCSGLTGYTLHVTTGSGPEDGIIFDSGVGSTEYTYTFPSDGTFYWHVAAWANGQRGAWASRRIVIDTSSPPPGGNWNARYDQGSTLWWDPNASINPRCTETINGPELHKDWGGNAPCGGMNGDDWVGDFDATINFSAGEYVFYLDHDDGVKMWLNGQNIQERGGSGSGPVCNGSGGYNLSGDENLRVLLREEGGDAHVHLTWNTDTSVCTSPPSCDASSVPSEYSKCAEEGEWCDFSGAQQVYYGANDCFKVKLFTDGVGCNNDNFGDPLPGVHKACYSPSLPAAPSLQSPGNGSTFNEGENISLSWSATGDEYYGEVWGGPAGTTSFGWQNNTSKNIGSQWAGYTYSWHVKARNGAGESGWSDTWTFTVKPVAPSNLSAQTASCSAVNLYWTDNSGNEEGYKIYRNGGYVGQVGANTANYQDTGLSENTSYSYYVKAFRGSIESDASNTVNVTTPPCAPPQPDLMPSQWGGWQYPVVPSSITGTSEVNTLYAGYPTYVDWGLSNAGDANTGGNTYGALYLDGAQIGNYDFGDVLPGQTWAFFDWWVTVDTPGWHTLKSVADPDDLIAESDEGNNVFQRDFYWTPVAPYADDMESGANDWTATGLWHQVDEYTSPYPASHSWSHSWWYGQDSTGDYDTGAANSGDLTSPPIYIPDPGYYLRFWYRYETETQTPNWDQRWLQISVDDGPFEDVWQLYDDPTNWWLQGQVIDLSGYAGHTIQVRFHFDTVDEYLNDYRGWYIDDFEISTTPPPACTDGHEPNDTPAQATAIAYGQTLDADICPGGDYDFYTFTGVAGDKVVVDIDAEVNGSLLDSYIFLLDSDGTSVLAQNDDEILGGVYDSHLGYYLPRDGTYYIKVKAWDHPSVGGSDYFYSIHLLTDDADPTAEITSPGHDAWLDSSLQIVTTDVNDDESGIRNVTFYWHDANWDGSSDWIVLADDWDSRDGWTYDLDTSGIPEQPQDCVVFIYAYDWAGNYAGYGSYHLGLDRTPPTVTADIYPMYGDAPFLDFWVNWWDSSDNLSGVASYDVQVRDGAGGAWADLVLDTTETYTRFVGLDAHTYYFRARARDFAGNQGDYAGGDGDAQYTVAICPTSPDAYEADDSFSAAQWITTDGISQTHNVHGEGDQDWVQFYAASSVTYTLATTTTGEHADTVLALYDTDGTTLINSNDDYGWSLASRLDWQPSTSGVYYAQVTHWDPWAYGCTTGYGLSIVTNDVTPPTGSVSIDGGEPYANTTAVTLNLAGTDVGTGVGQVMASNQADFAGASWVAYADTLDWTLTLSDGDKTVHVRFRDRAGNESGVYSDTIVLDTTPPTGSLLIAGGAEVVTSTQVVLILSASDAHDVTHMRLKNNADAWGAWEPFAASRTWTLPVQPGDHTVWVQFRDAADNVSVAYADAVIYDYPYHVHLPLVMRNH